MGKTFTKDTIGDVAREILGVVELRRKEGESATVVALSGDLGAGKTTLTQTIARELGSTNSVISPTFVIMKSYDLPRTALARGFSTLVHIDAYRLNSHKELEKLGWAELLDDPKNLILIEWPEKVPESIPEGAIRITLAHKSEEEREIQSF